MTPSVQFRRARPEEADSLSEIAFASKQSWGYPPAWMEFWRSDLTITPEYLKLETVCIAEWEARIIGFGGLSWIGQRRYVEHLWLSPEFIGRGFGRLLFTQMVELAEGEGIRELFIHSDPHAEAFYLHLGAVRIGAKTQARPDGLPRELPVLVYRLA